MIHKVKRNFQNQLGYVGLLVALIGFFSYYFYLTFDYNSRETWLFPRVIIGLGLLFVVLDLLTIAFSNQIDEFLETEGESVQEKASSRTESDVIQPKSYVASLAIQVVWLIGYIAGVYYIGFFTTTFLYSALYIGINRDERNAKTAVIAVGVGLGLVVFLWLLFVELMNSAAVFRLGRFP